MLTRGKKLRHKLANEMLRSPEFRRALQEAADNISQQALPAANEATVSGAFERELYAVLRDVGLTFNPTKEVRIDGIRHSEQGRIDSRLGEVVIEFKRPSKLRTAAQVQAATRQLCDYLTAITRNSSTETAYGFLTDGRTYLEVRSLSGHIASKSSPAPLTGGALLRLVKSIHALSLSALSAKNLVRDFCGNQADGVLFGAARAFHKVLAERATPKTQMLRTEWEELFRLGHNDKSQQRMILERRQALSDLFGVALASAEAEYRALFALHTAYALVVKFMAFRALSELRFHDRFINWQSLSEATDDQLRVRCADLEDGALFRRVNVLNLLEGDFFSWYTDERQWSDGIATAVRDVLTVLGRYEQTSNLFAATGAIDLFREI